MVWEHQAHRQTLLSPKIDDALSPGVLALHHIIGAVLSVENGTALDFVIFHRYSKSVMGIRPKSVRGIRTSTTPPSSQAQLCTMRSSCCN